MTAAGFQEFVENVSRVVEAAGVAIIVLGLLWATLVWLRDLAPGRGVAPGAYRRYRRNLGMAVLLGLEFLVAADIIRTVAVDLSFTSLGVLALLVAVRTFLSFTIELEVDGKWPWQRPDSDGRAEPA